MDSNEEEVVVVGEKKTMKFLKMYPMLSFCKWDLIMALCVDETEDGYVMHRGDMDRVEALTPKQMKKIARGIGMALVDDQYWNAMRDLYEREGL